MFGNNPDKKRDLRTPESSNPPFQDSEIERAAAVMRVVATTHFTRLENTLLAILRVGFQDLDIAKSSDGKAELERQIDTVTAKLTGLLDQEFGSGSAQKVSRQIVEIANRLCTEAHYRPAIQTIGFFNKAVRYGLRRASEAMQDDLTRIGEFLSNHLYGNMPDDRKGLHAITRNEVNLSRETIQALAFCAIVIARLEKADLTDDRLIDATQICRNRFGIGISNDC